MELHGWKISAAMPWVGETDISFHSDMVSVEESAGSSVKQGLLIMTNESYPRRFTVPKRAHLNGAYRKNSEEICHKFQLLALLTSHSRYLVLLKDNL
ncbi:hypothetical protein OIU74_007478 [Salix koriyanagi]|uniref:Uncharacterized protein n=1 Tax=Salix koriyanagi TaxID=2511006 RepID=A0A9Q0U3V8_9ROSI|nr:hypothetical protein OIU74_007478 [Salix koriyanagi]